MSQRNKESTPHNFRTPETDTAAIRSRPFSVVSNSRRAHSTRSCRTKWEGLRPSLGQTDGENFVKAVTAYHTNFAYNEARQLHKVLGKQIEVICHCSSVTSRKKVTFYG